MWSSGQGGFRDCLEDTKGEAGRCYAGLRYECPVSRRAPSNVSMRIAFSAPRRNLMPKSVQ